MGARNIHARFTFPFGGVGYAIHPAFDGYWLEPLVRYHMREAATVSELPTVPAVYALCGGRGHGLYVAYVGIAEILRRRIRQHLVTRDSSVTTGASLASLNPDLILKGEHRDRFPLSGGRFLADAARFLLLPFYLCCAPRGKTHIAAAICCGGFTDLSRYY